MSAATPPSTRAGPKAGCTSREAGARPGPQIRLCARGSRRRWGRPRPSPIGCPQRASRPGSCGTISERETRASPCVNVLSLRSIVPTPELMLRGGVLVSEHPSLHELAQSVGRHFFLCLFSFFAVHFKGLASCLVPVQVKTSTCPFMKLCHLSAIIFPMHLVAQRFFGMRRQNYLGKGMHLARGIA